MSPIGLMKVLLPESNGSICNELDKICSVYVIISVILGKLC